MKAPVFLLIIFLAAGISSNAQTNAGYTSNEEATALANLLGVQKKEAVAKMVPVSGKDSVAFWKLYDEYQKENNKVIKSRISLYERTAAAYANMTPAIADSLANEYFSNRADQEKSLQVYYNKMKAAINPVVAFEFFQGETYLLTLVRAQIMNQIPTYGELMHAAKK